GVEESLVNEAEVADEVKAEIKKLRKAYNDASGEVTISTFKKAGSEDADAEDQFTTFGDMITKTVDEYKDQVNSLSGLDDEKDPKGKENKEKLEKAVTKFKDEIAALEPEAGATEVKPQVKAALEVKQFQAELALAELNGEDTAEIQTKLDTAIATAKVKPQQIQNTGGNDDLTDDQKARIKEEQDQIDRLEAEIRAEEAKDEPNQAAIAGKRRGIEKSKQDITNIKAEQMTSLRINSKDLKIVSEASLSGLQAYDSEEDGYKWLKAEAKKMGVKLSVDKDPYGDGTDELNATGSKSALQKFAKLTGHDQDLGTEEEGAVYVIKETKETIKLDESMSVAEKFAILMNK
ncbi:hypothetical protein OAB94_01020, partial [Flavobacteriaceae bacterium]|nr:hypothetical protein [Flavobacteriaceae bacterium]